MPRLSIRPIHRREWYNKLTKMCVMNESRLIRENECVNEQSGAEDRESDEESVLCVCVCMCMYMCVCE